MVYSQIINISKMNRYRPQVSFPFNPLSGTLYVSSMISEANPFQAYEENQKFCLALKDNQGESVLHFHRIYDAAACSWQFLRLYFYGSALWRKSELFGAEFPLGILDRGDYKQWV